MRTSTVRLYTCANGEIKAGFTWRQKLVLRAASAVDYLPFRALRQITSIPSGVYKSLVIAGYLQQHKGGWEITPMGREQARWWTEKEINQLQKEEKRHERQGFEDYGRRHRRSAG